MGYFWFILWFVLLFLCTWANLKRKQTEKFFGPKSFIDREHEDGK